MERFQNLYTKNSLESLYEVRKGFNASIMHGMVLDASAFASNSPEAEKKRLGLSWILEANELYLQGTLTAASPVSLKLKAELDKGWDMVMHLPTPIINIIMPGATGTGGTLAVFNTGRSKRESTT